MYTSEHKLLFNEAVTRLQHNLESTLPFTGSAIWNWIISQHPPDAWTHPRGFPFCLILWWVEQDINGANDFAFQTDLIYASITAYCQIRLVDNVMDGHAQKEYQ